MKDYDKTQIILAKCCVYYDVPMRRLKELSRDNITVRECRNMAVAMIYELTDLTQADIAVIFNRSRDAITASQKLMTGQLKSSVQIRRSHDILRRYFTECMGLS